MTTPVTVGPVAPTASDRRIPFGRMVRTELRKLADTRAGRWLLVALAAAGPITVAIILFAVEPKDLTFDRFINFTQTPQKVLLPVLGILAITSEWSQRTGLVTFTLVPDRGRVLRAKIVAIGCLGTALIVVIYPLAAIGNVLGMALRGGDGNWSSGMPGLGEITLVLLTGLMQGIAFGALLLISSAAIVAYFVLPNLTSVLVGSASGLDDAAPWFDLNQAQGRLYSHEMTGTAWVQLLTAVTIWVALPLAIGIVRVLRSEVKSG